MTRAPSPKTPYSLGQTILLGLGTGAACIISAGQIEEHLRGLDETQRREWQEGFCAQDGLSASPVCGGVLFARSGA